MRLVYAIALAGVVGLVTAGCSEETVDQTKDAAASAAQDTKEAAQKAADEAQSLGDKIADKTADVTGKVAGETAEFAGKTADKTKELAGLVAVKTKEAAEATADVVTDGWITTKITAKIADETILDGSSINVDTKDKVVTLKGTVKSAAAKEKAESIATGTKGVAKVISQLVVK